MYFVETKFWFITEKHLKHVRIFYRKATKVSLYSQTSLIWTPKGQDEVSALQRCLYYRGISGTKQTVHKRGVCILEVSVRRG